MKTKIPRRFIVQKLIKEGKQPKSAKIYTEAIVNNVLNGKSIDDNVIIAHSELISTFLNS
jgi:hypothetical protein